MRLTRFESNSMLMWVAVGFCAASIGCSQSKPDVVTGPTLDVPQFSIKLQLSPMAAKRLQSMGESIKVVAYFDGDALPGQGKYNAPMRDVYLGSSEKIANSKYEAQFDDVKVPQREWNKLSDKNYFVTINTSSARKVQKDALLDCNDPMSVRIDDMKGKTTVISCWLIEEHSK